MGSGRSRSGINSFSVYRWYLHGYLTKRTVDTVYKLNRFTGNVWLIKTYDKQVGQMRVLAAREASVEATKDLNGDANMPGVGEGEL